MKTGTGRWLAAAIGLWQIAAGLGVADDSLPPCWRGRPDTTLQNWRFDTNSNPAAPQLVANPNGAPTLSIQLGQAAAGWVNQLFLFGTNQGVWDLGLNGTMTLGVPNQAKPVGSWKIIWVQVNQYQDGIYTRLAAVAIPGATFVGAQTRTNGTTSFGGQWIEHRTAWLMAPCPASETIVITGGTNGAPSSAIDQVVVDTICLTADCPTNLTLTADAGQCSRANVTWPLPSVDGCVFTNVTCVPASGSTFNVGTTPVSCVIRDAYGHVVNCGFSVTIADNQPPSANCPGDITVAANPGLCGEFVTFNATASDNCPGATIACVPASGSFFFAGSTVVTCTAQDATGLTNQCSFTVTVTAPPSAPGDALPPCWRGLTNTTFQDWAFSTSANPAAPEVVNNPHGAPTAAVSPGTFSAGWQDQIPGLGCRQGIWDLGSSGVIRLDITNRAGAASSKKYVRIQTTQWQDGALYNQLAVVTFPNLPGAALVSHPPATVVETIPGVGRWVVDLQVWRLAPCPDTELIQLTGGIFGSLIDEVIVDTLCQDIVCPVDISTNTDPGACVASGITWSLPPIDGCLVRTIVCTTNGVPVTQPTSFPLGLTLVNCDITDAENQVRNCAFTVQVVDVEPPQLLACAPPLSVAAGTNCLALVPDFTTAVTATDCNGPLNITQFPPAGTPVGTGVHVIALSIRDAANNATNCTTTFTVSDQTPPDINIGQSFGNGEVTLECGLGWGFTIPILTDNCDPQPAITLNIFSTVTNAVVCGNSFTATRVWQAIDTSGNTSYATQIVHQVDHTAPQITACPPALLLSCLAVVPAPDVSLVTATDYCDGGFGVYPPVPVVITHVGDVTNGVNPTIITRTYRASDSCSNAAVCTQTITVHDTELPQFVCPAAITNNTDIGQCSATFSLPPLLATDNCGVASVTSNAPSVFPVGSTLVTWTVVDVNDNTNTCSQLVVIRDAEAPTIATCPAGVSSNAGANCLALVPDFTASVVAGDNCTLAANLVVTQSPAPGTSVGLGVHVITLTVTDAATNSATCTTSFTVNPAADLAVAVTASPATTLVGQPVTYSVTVTNIGGCTASDVVLSNFLSPGQVLLTMTNVGAGTMSACPAPGAVAWWAAEGDALDKAGANDGSASGSVGYAGGQVGQAYSFDGLTGVVTVPDAPALRPASLTVEGWIRIQDPNGVHVIVSKPRGSGMEESFAVWISSGTLHAAVSDAGGSGTFLSYPDFPTSSLFVFADIVNLPSLAAKLKVPVDPVSTHLNGLLSAPTLNLLALYAGGPDAPLQRALVSDFNTIIQGGTIYDGPRFAGVTLAPETAYLLGRNPSGVDLVRLNRLLIRDAYPTEIASVLFPQLNQWHHVAYTFDDSSKVQALYVNGQLVDVGVVNKTITYDASALLIGAGNSNGTPGFYYQGLVDELTIYSRALSGLEVEAIHDAAANGKCTTSGPLSLGSLASGGSATVVLTATPVECPSVSLEATVTTSTFDPVLANNQSSASVTVQDHAPGTIALSIRRVSINNNYVRIFWPLTCAPYVLEGTPSLDHPITWVPSLLPLQVIDGSYSTVVHADDAHRFFRLHLP